jgi:hypothetical protein
LAIERSHSPSTNHPPHESTILQRLFDGKAPSQDFSSRFGAELLAEPCCALVHLVAEGQSVDIERVPRRPDLRRYLPL